MLLKRTLFLTALLGTVLISCTKEEDPAPELIVDQTSIAFEESDPSIQVIITNAGDKPLNWEINSDDTWVTFSEASGSLSKGSKSIYINANIAISPGTYNTSITIKSNGGNHTITASITVTEKVTLFPGVGISQLNLYDNYQTLLNTFGSPDQIYHGEIDASQGIYGHELAYYDLGISCLFLNGETESLANEDAVFFIYIFPPYQGKTEDDLDLTSSLAEIQAVYGTTDYIDYYTTNSIEAEDHNYTEEGITFTFASDRLNDVEFFLIYEPYTPSSVGAKQLSTFNLLPVSLWNFHHK